ncbi:hypothetical protein [Vulcanisaeta distributa]|uniref:hypothetical protein n=1 Tax=Vulcanisaeta distributa TaxID=164451 RepID=UPI0006D05587|nr:hypothetical protein [Vulcanisaeta distributa]
MEYFKWAVVNIEVVEDKPIFNTYPDFCGTGREFITNSIGYLRLHAKNSGPGIARNCVAQVRVLRRLSIDGSGECRGGGPSLSIIIGLT